MTYSRVISWHASVDAILGDANHVGSRDIRYGLLGGYGKTDTVRRSHLKVKIEPVGGRPPPAAK